MLCKQKQKENRMKYGNTVQVLVVETDTMEESMKKNC